MRQIKVAANNPTITETARAKLECDEEFLGCLFISSSNQKMYGNLKKELHNNFLMDRDSYPRTLESAKRLLAGYKPAWTPQRQIVKQEGRVTFIQSQNKNRTKAPGEKKTNSRGDSHCYKCGEEALIHWTARMTR